MTACRVLTCHFWLIIEIGGPLDCIFGKIFLGNIFNHQEDAIGIILSPNLSLQDHWFGFYSTLNDGMPGFNTSFWSVIKIGGSFYPIFGKIFSGNIVNHQENPLGIILIPNLGVQDHQCGFQRTLNDSMPGFNGLFLAHYQKSEAFWTFFFWQNIFWKYLKSSRGRSWHLFKPKFRSLASFV